MLRKATLLFTLPIVSMEAGAVCVDWPAREARARKSAEVSFVNAFAERLVDYRLNLTKDPCYNELRTLLRSWAANVPQKLRDNDDMLGLLGEFYALEGEATRAATYYEALLLKRPGDVPALAFLAEWAREQKQEESERQLLEKLDALKPAREADRAIQLRARERLFLLRSQEGDVEAALRVSDNFALTGKDSPALLLRRAELALRAGDLPRLESSADLLGKAGRSDWAEYFRALLHLQRGNTEKGLPALERVLAKKFLSNDQRQQALRLAGRAYAQTQRYPQARRAAETLLNLGPNDTEARALHEQALFAGALDRAAPERDLERAAQLNPLSLAIQLKLVELRLQKGDAARRRDAEARLKKLEEEHAGELALLYWQGRLALSRRQTAEAMLYFGSAISALREGKPAGNLRRADLFMFAAKTQSLRGAVDEARKLLSEGLASSPSEAEKVELRKALEALK